MKLHLKQSRGNNSESMKARVANLVCDTLSRPLRYTVKTLAIHCQDPFYITVKYHDNIPKFF